MLIALRDIGEKLAARWDLSWRRFWTMFKFMAAGLPAFILAVPLNYLLVEWGHWGKGYAYALVMAAQVTVNFFMCRAFVFQRRAEASLGAQFGAFFFGIMAFRLADWLVYYALVHWAGWYYLIVQFFNVAVFAALKFIYSERIFHARERAADKDGGPQPAL